MSGSACCRLCFTRTRKQRGRQCIERLSRRERVCVRAKGENPLHHLIPSLIFSSLLFSSLLPSVKPHLPPLSHTHSHSPIRVPKVTALPANPFPSLSLSLLIEGLQPQWLFLLFLSLSSTFPAIVRSYPCPSCHTRARKGQQRREAQSRGKRSVFSKEFFKRRFSSSLHCCASLLPPPPSASLCSRLPLCMRRYRRTLHASPLFEQGRWSRALLARGEERRGKGREATCSQTRLDPCLVEPPFPLLLCLAFRLSLTLSFSAWPVLVLVPLLVPLPATVLLGLCRPLRSRFRLPGLL